MRPIDADALMREFAEYVRRSNNSDFAYIPTWNDAVSLLGSAPTIDAVPVVRCKDCKYWREETDHTCRKWGGASPRNANGYCDDGERSEASLCDNCDEKNDVGCSWCKKMERSE